MYRPFVKLRGVPRAPREAKPREAAPRVAAPRLPRNLNEYVAPRAPEPDADVQIDADGELRDLSGSEFRDCGGGSWLRVTPDGVCEMLLFEDGKAVILDGW